jgi:hypothetical protein
MSDSLFFRVTVQVVAQHLTRETSRQAEEVRYFFAAFLNSFARHGRQDFYAVASGDNQPLAQQLAVHKGLQALSARLFRKRQKLAYFNRRGLVINSD